MAKARLVVVLLAITLLMAACGPKVDRRTNNLALDFGLETLGGQSVRLSDLRDGKPALLEFWGST